MQKLNILIVTFFLVACQQQSSNTPSNIVKSIQEIKVAEIIPPSFNCLEHKDSLKEMDTNIQAVQDIRELNENEKQIFSFSAKMGGKDLSSGYVLDQKIPGKIQGICVAEVFFSDGTNHNVIFTVSDVDGNGYIAYQDYAPLQAIALLMSLSQPSVQQLPEEPKIVQQPDVPVHAIPNDVNVNLEAVKQENQVATNVTSETKITPSFNCDKASTLIEKTICSSKALADLDNNVALAYQNALSNGTDVNLKASQKEWIRKRNTCQTEKCIEKAYVERWQDLAPSDFEEHD